MTRRRQFVNAVAVSLPTGPGAPRAQVPGRVYRVGILRPTGKAPPDVNVPDALRKLGHASTIPIVRFGNLDPVALGLVKSREVIE